MRLLLWAWIGMWLSGIGDGGGALASELTRVLPRLKPGIVGVGTVQHTRALPSILRGTGFAVADGQHIITNAHVIPDKMNAKEREFLAVFVGQGKQSKVWAAQVVGLDPDHDLALLRMEGPPLPALSLATPGTAQEGEEYAFTGFPLGIVLGLYPVTHRGIISAITPIATPVAQGEQLTPEMIKRLKEPYDVLQLDATAYPGNSGSPLYNTTTGEVVGIVNMVFIKETKENLLQKPSGISYAIPIQYARALLDKAGLHSPLGKR